ncbi:MAG: NtaA/DmoA family FMN-dependent monooxygenase [Caulobacteraceae bacterium]
MTETRQLKLGAFMRPASIHTGAWRYPGGAPDLNFNFPLLARCAQRLEAAKFDAFFMADHLAVLNMPIEALKRSQTVTSFEPFTMLSALAMLTQRIGLVATRLDPPSTRRSTWRGGSPRWTTSRAGRAGWNIVTTSNPDSALNFGLDEHMEHDERYRRAREFYDVVTGLWDSFAEDAFVRDIESGIYFDPERMHVLDHKGKYLSVRGPLNIARPPQGWPVIVQAGASEAGRQLAAETAEMVFAPSPNLKGGQALYADIKGRMARLGRDPEGLKMLPGAFVVVGDTVEEAAAKRAKLDSLVHYDSAIASLSIGLGGGRLAVRSGRAAAADPGDQRQPLGPRAGDRAGRARGPDRAPARPAPGRLRRPRLRRHGQTIADEMETWLHERGSDGFNVMFPYLPGGLDDFCDKVVPELQRRGLFRTEYEGPTLRDNLGLARPKNRFF